MTPNWKLVCAQLCGISSTMVRKLYRASGYREREILKPFYECSKLSYGLSKVVVVSPFLSHPLPPVKAGKRLNPFCKRLSLSTRFRLILYMVR